MTPSRSTSPVVHDRWDTNLYRGYVSFRLRLPTRCRAPPSLATQYPATGLLLEREFRTFEEREEGGERVYTPVVPLIRSLANFGLPENESGKTQGNETLVMRVTVPAHSQSWGVNISPEKHSDFTDVFFHFNPRRRFVAMNNREDNIWGQQVLAAFFGARRGHLYG